MQSCTPPTPISFFHDAPIPVFPISWQDTGSGVFSVAVSAVLLGLGPVRAEPSRRLALLAALTGLGALLVDIYLHNRRWGFTAARRSQVSSSTAVVKLSPLY